VTTPTSKADFAAAEKSLIRMDVETYYDVQEVRIQVDHRVRNYAEERALAACAGEAEIVRLRNLGDKNVAYKKEIRERKTKEDHPDFKKFGEAFAKALTELEDEHHHKKVNNLMASQEKIIVTRVSRLVAKHPLWSTWLANVRGIGPCIAGGLLSWIDIHKAIYVGNLWKYAGLAVTVDRMECPECNEVYTDVPNVEARIAKGMPKEPPRCEKDGTFLRIFGHSNRREKGKMLGYNPRVKTLCWKAGESFVKQDPKRSGYRRLYEQFRTKIEDKIAANNGFCHKEHKNDKGNPIGCFSAHKYAMAKRAAVKIFMSHVYLKWRGLLGLPVHDPYAFKMLGHTSEEMIQPFEDPK